MDFGKIKAVQNFSISIGQNEIFGLLGHNGAGKTTTINMLTGMIKPTSGDAHIYGNSLVN
jgi:ABC-type multidrug transport system ATPase subunit